MPEREKADLLHAGNLIMMRADDQFSAVGLLSVWQYWRPRLSIEPGKQILQGLFCQLLRNLLLFDWSSRRKLLGRERHPYLYGALPGGGPHHEFVLTAVLLNSDSSHPAPLSQSFHDDNAQKDDRPRAGTD
jgi:hypothetical protein